MDFQNGQINISEIPAVENLILKPINPLYLKSLQRAWLIGFGILFLIFAIPVILISELREFWVLTGIGTFYFSILLLTVIIGTGSFRRKAYAIREHDLIYTTGWIFRKLHVIPFNRIQHAMLRSGPIDRKFGLASMAIFTAASLGRDITIPGFEEEEAEKIKDFIIQKINGKKENEGLV